MTVHLHDANLVGKDGDVFVRDVKYYTVSSGVVTLEKANGTVVYAPLSNYLYVEMVPV